MIRVRPPNPLEAEHDADLALREMLDTVAFDGEDFEGGAGRVFACSEEADARSSGISRVISRVEDSI